MKRNIIRYWRIADAVARSRSVDLIAHEVGELENIFALLVLGPFVGIASPPIQITLELMPEMRHEFRIMLEKVSTANDPLGELFAVLGID